jgi:hypothetical protein
VPTIISCPNESKFKRAQNIFYPFIRKTVIFWLSQWESSLQRLRYLISFLFSLAPFLMIFPALLFLRYNVVPFQLKLILQASEATL